MAKTKYVVRAARVNFLLEDTEKDKQAKYARYNRGETFTADSNDEQIDRLVEKNLVIKESDLEKLREQRAQAGAPQVAADDIEEQIEEAVQEATEASEKKVSDLQSELEKVRAELKAAKATSAPVQTPAKPADSK